MARVVVLGAGAMGLAAAHRALGRGHQVVLLEAAPEPGGMAAHFDLGGLSIERYYHFVCKADQPTFDLMAELGIGGKMRWRPTSMGYFAGGALHPWGDPVSLLRFPGLSLAGKLRYGALMFLSARRDALGRAGDRLGARLDRALVRHAKSMTSSGVPCSTSSSTNTRTRSRRAGSGPESAGSGDRVAR